MGKVGGLLYLNNGSSVFPHAEFNGYCCAVM